MVRLCSSKEWIWTWLRTGQKIRTINFLPNKVENLESLGIVLVLTIVVAQNPWNCQQLKINKNYESEQINGYPFSWPRVTCRPVCNLVSKWIKASLSRRVGKNTLQVLTPPLYIGFPGWKLGSIWIMWLSMGKVLLALHLEMSWDSFAVL